MNTKNDVSDLVTLGDRLGGFFFPHLVQLWVYYHPDPLSLAAAILDTRHCVFSSDFPFYFQPLDPYDFYICP